MSRKNRVHYEHAFYHVMLRGNYRQAIFVNTDDYLEFNSQLEDIVATYGCRIHLYCLMTNHVHLLLEVTTIPLSKIMQKLVSCYAKSFNRKRNQQGHLFQNRYKAKTVCSYSYLLELIYYIHHNPVKAGLVKNINDYPWSSHNCYLLNNSAPWLTTEFILKILKKKYLEIETPYSSFMSEFKSDGLPIESDTEQSGLLTINDFLNNSFTKTNSLDLSNFSVNYIAKYVCGFMNIEIEKISSVSQNKLVCTARNAIAYFAHYYANHTLVKIAVYFDRKSDSVSCSLHRNLSNAEFLALLKKLNYSFLNKITVSDTGKTEN